jgi:dolichyl-phosphate-mannose-protein mannosyltransferase
MKRLMESFRERKYSLAFYVLAALTSASVVVGVWARIYHIGFPSNKIWDEIYFPTIAYQYIQSLPFTGLHPPAQYNFDLHPPLGKFILAISIAIFGNTPLGWRLMPSIFGCLMIGLAYVLGWQLTKDRVAALLLTVFIAMDTIFVIYSRTGIMDGILVFFVLATFLASLWVEERRQVIWVAVLLGLTISVKWAALMVAVPAGYVLWRKGFFRQFLGGLYISAILYLAIVYIGQFIIPTGAGKVAQEAHGLGIIWNRWVLVWQWHLQALRNVTVASANPASSPWWSWPLMLHPILLRRILQPDGGLLLIMVIGNPILWWSSTLAVVWGFFQLVYNKLISKVAIADNPLVPLLLGYVFLLLPWVPSTRLPYLYNYLPSYAFAVLTLTYLLSRLWGRGRWGPWVVVAFTVIVIACGAYFLPMVMAFPLSPDGLDRHLWLNSWL